MSLPSAIDRRYYNFPVCEFHATIALSVKDIMFPPPEKPSEQWITDGTGLS